MTTKEAARRKRRRARKLGLCLWCVQPRATGRSLCEKHLEDLRVASAARRLAAAKARRKKAKA